MTKARHVSVIDERAECPFCHQIVRLKLEDGFYGEIKGQYLPLNPCEHFVNVFRNRMGGHLVARFEDEKKEVKGSK